MTDTALRITEIFTSLQGEADTVGWPTTFVRLTGCPLRCVYCDSAYAFNGGERMTLESITTQVKDANCTRVCVTGGEPLAQPEVHTLLKCLCDMGLDVSLETSGALAIDKVDDRVSVVMDLKTPSSRELEKNLYENIEWLKPTDQVKFVIADKQDYDWARLQVDRFAIADKVKNVLFSPSFESLDTKTLAEWILNDRLNVRLQIQLHKLIWGDKPGV